jgi:hypothetical protein
MNQISGFGIVSLEFRLAFYRQFWEEFKRLTFLAGRRYIFARWETF